MTWKKRRIIVIVLCVSVLSLFVRSAVSGIEGGHNFEGQCGRCHLNDPIAGGNPLFVKEINRLCQECHPQQGQGLSHPTSIKPSSPLPPELKLDVSGKMTCITCHQTHGTRKNLLVNGETGKAFCLFCHQVALQSKDSGGHEVVSSLVHQPQYEQSDEVLDKESQECLSCHDGGLATLQDVSPAARIGGIVNTAGSSHPVGIPYRQLITKDGYKNFNLLDKNIRFFGGKLGCGSCHSIYSGHPAKLVIDNSGSALCKACHDK